MIVYIDYKIITPEGYVLQSFEQAKHFVESLKLWKTESESYIKSCAKKHCIMPIFDYVEV